MRVPLSAWVAATATLVVFSSLAACSPSGDVQNSSAVESVGPTVPGRQGGSTAVVTSNTVAIPWRVTDVSNQLRVIDITFRKPICSDQHVSVHQIRLPGSSLATWVTTITVRQTPDESLDCVTGAEAPVTKTIRAEHPMIGCSAKLIDGSTGKPPMFKRSLRSQLVWSCPAEILVCNGGSGSASLTPSNPPIAYVERYISCLNEGNREEAQSLWLDAIVPESGTKASFHPVNRQCDVNREHMGMGMNAYRFIVAVPGVYTEVSPSGERARNNHAVFILLRDSQTDPWRISGLTDSDSDLVRGC